MDRRLDSLHPGFKPFAMELIARIVEENIAVMIVNTRRTEAEQAELLVRRATWVAHSKHQDGLAIDLAPYEQYALHGPDKLQWNARDIVWMRMGLIGEKLGLVWGGRWAQKDLGHFEWPRSVPSTEAA